MRLENWLRLVAGKFVLISVILGFVHSALWFLLTAFVGFNLFQSAFTNWCPMMFILKKFGVEE